MRDSPIGFHSQTKGGGCLCLESLESSKAMLYTEPNRFSSSFKFSQFNHRILHWAACPRWVVQSFYFPISTKCSNMFFLIWLPGSVVIPSIHPSSGSLNEVVVGAVAGYTHRKANDNYIALYLVLLLMCIIIHSTKNGWLVCPGYKDFFIMCQHTVH